MTSSSGGARLVRREAARESAPASRVRPLARLFVRLLLFALTLELFSQGIFANSSISRMLLLSPSDVAWRIFWWNHRAVDVDVAFTFDVYDPTRGWALRPNVHELTVFGDHVLNSSSRGIRGTAEFSYDRTLGRTRIVAIGDSLTFGDFVSDDETYSGFMSRMIPGAEVINLGVHGYGQDQMLVYLQEEGSKYRPDIVVLGFTSFSMPSNLLEFRDYAKPRYRMVGEDLEIRNSPVPDIEAVTRQGVGRLRSPALVETLFLGARYWAGLSGVEDLTAAILERMAEEIRSIPAEPVFVYLPLVSEIHDPSEAPTPEEAFFVRASRRCGVVPLLLRPAFARRIREGARFETNLLAHWGSAEHRVAAVEIVDHLRERGLIPAEKELGRVARTDGPR